MGLETDPLALLGRLGRNPRGDDVGRLAGGVFRLVVVELVLGDYLDDGEGMDVVVAQYAYGRLHPLDESLDKHGVVNRERCLDRGEELLSTVDQGDAERGPLSRGLYDDPLSQLRDEGIDLELLGRLERDRRRRREPVATEQRLRHVFVHRERACKDTRACIGQVEKLADALNRPVLPIPSVKADEGDIGLTLLEFGEIPTLPRVDLDNGVAFAAQGTRDLLRRGKGDRAFAGETALEQDDRGAGVVGEGRVHMRSLQRKSTEAEKIAQHERPHPEDYNERRTTRRAEEDAREESRTLGDLGSGHEPYRNHHQKPEGHHHGRGHDDRGVVLRLQHRRPGGNLEHRPRGEACEHGPGDHEEHKRHPRHPLGQIGQRGEVAGVLDVHGLIWEIHRAWRFRDIRRARSGRDGRDVGDGGCEVDLRARARRDGWGDGEFGGPRLGRGRLVRLADDGNSTRGGEEVRCGEGRGCELLGSLFDVSEHVPHQGDGLGVQIGLPDLRDAGHRNVFGLFHRIPSSRYLEV